MSDTGQRLTAAMRCEHHPSNQDYREESDTYFCRLCELQERCRDAEKNETELVRELDALRADLAASRAEVEQNRCIGLDIADCAKQVEQERDALRAHVKALEAFVVDSAKRDHTCGMGGSPHCFVCRAAALLATAQEPPQ